MKKKETYSVRCALCGMYLGISLDNVEVIGDCCDDRQDEVVGWYEEDED